VILARQGAIVGVTSAAAVWVLASIGVVIALGLPWLGVKIAVLTVIILVGVDVVENRFEALQRGVHHKLERLAREHGKPPHPPDDSE
jgi:putative Mg2+ transporter-C (MgtC) family protein